MFIVSVVLLAIICILALATALPGILPWSFLPVSYLEFPLAQLIAFRVPLFLGICVVAILLLLFLRFVGILRKLVSVVALGILGVTAFIHGYPIWERGLNQASDFTLPVTSQTVNGINMLTYNTLGGATTMEDILPVVLENEVQVISLIETTSADAKYLAAMLAEHGQEFQVFHNQVAPTEPHFYSTALLVAKELGEYQILNHDLNALDTSVVVEPVQKHGSGRFASLTLPQLAVVHPIAPMPQYMPYWTQETKQVYQACAQAQNFIMLGDFNSTIDHQLAHDGQCADAASEAGAGAIGTWPVAAPKLLGTPIDRVLHDGNYWEGVKARVIEVGESDHRGLLVQLQSRTPQNG